jgi:hypothetical protein
MDKKFQENQWVELVVHTQANALKKFYSSNKEAQEKADDRSIISRLTKRVMDKQDAKSKKDWDARKISEEKEKDRENRQTDEFKKEKAYMQLERKAKNGWVLEQHDIWFNFYLSHEIMKGQNKAGTLRITTLGDAV